MKFPYQVALASLVSILVILAPASAYALKATNGPHTRSQTYHDRTPKVHTHGSHTPHH